MEALLFYSSVLLRKASHPIFKRVWGLGGSFFTGKDYFEMRYLEDGSIRSAKAFNRPASPLAGVRFVKDN